MFRAQKPNNVDSNKKVKSKSKSKRHGGTWGRGGIAPTHT
jgi:hypothetical protein